MACPLSILFACIGSGIYCFFTYGNLDLNVLYQPAKFMYERVYCGGNFFFMCFFFFFLRLPWDQNSILSWMGESIFAIIGVGSYFIVILSFLTLFISICEYHYAIHKLYRCRINAIDDMVRNEDIKRSIYNSILFHASAKKCGNFERKYFKFKNKNYFSAFSTERQRFTAYLF